jgi:hypothetical protein
MPSDPQQAIFADLTAVIEANLRYARTLVAALENCQDDPRLVAEITRQLEALRTVHEVIAETLFAADRTTGASTENEGDGT